jgi:acyl dehydratase
MDAQAKALYLEDLTVGDGFETAEVTVTEQDIYDFAGAYDPQPFHLDRAAAEASLFHGLAASGWHTAALTMRMLVTSGALHDGLIGAGVELTWPTPTRPGDVLHVHAEIASITPSRSKPDRGIVALHCETLTHTGEVRQRMTANLLVFRRPE